MDQEVEENVTDWMMVGRVITSSGSGGRGECYRLDDGRSQRKAVFTRSDCEREGNIV